MECGNCGNETNDELKYCEYCGADMVFDEMEYAGTVSAKAGARAKLSSEEQIRVALLGSVFLLLSVFLIRFVLIQRTNVEVHPVYFLPMSVAEEGLDENIDTHVDLELVPIPYPPDE